MSFFVEKFIAWRYLRTKRKESFISVISWFSFTGIMLGVATLIIVMSVMNGFRHELLTRILGLNGHFTLHSSNLNGLKNFEQAQNDFESLSDVFVASPLISKQGLFLANGAAGGGMIHGMRYSDLEKRPLISKNIIAGSLKEFSEPNMIVIGQKLAKKLNLYPGDALKLMAPESQATALGFIPRSRHFRIAAIFDSGMHEYDSAFVFIPLKSAQDFFELEDCVNGMEIFVKDPTYLSQIQTLIKKKAAPYELMVYNWQEANATFFGAIEVERNVMFLILSLIVLVAVFNIISCLVMLVKDKTRDIAILRTMGASQGVILRVFFLTGSFIGILGTLVGTLLGLGFSYNIEHIRHFLEKISGVELFRAEIYFLAKLPARVELSEAALVIFIAIIFSFLATLYPAWKASRLAPVEALRYE